ncbi:hypothetical protein GCM10009759_27730 [Kitasatospora saccharophila]|uniref:Uncharacterized protein n=1 Tax=Kitasatospora saccharophila TaxID=407973 RepID=A0ABP5IED5_9ACTN
MTDTIYFPPGHDAEDLGQRTREHVVNNVLAEAGKASRRAAE